MRLILQCAALVVLLTGGSRIAESQDTSIRTFPLGAGASGAYGLATGDFNNDGIPDLITSNQSSDNVSVLLGLGEANFGAAAVFPTGGQPKGIAVGDFNRDGNLDVVTANFGSGSISVLFGNGDGTFQAHQDFPAGIQTQSVAVGDVNDDGIPDIVVSSVQSENTDVFLSNGDGTFQPPISFIFNNGYAAWTQTALADMNGDGILDFVGVFGFGQGFQVWLGNGDGTFYLWSKPLFEGTLPYPNGLVLGDFNGDGKIDVVTGLILNNVITVSLNRGGGFFPQAVSTNGPSGTVVLAAGDLNGDGKLDVISTGLDENLLDVGIGNGDGSFQLAHPYHLSGSPVAALVGRFSSDRKLDIAFATSSGVGLIVR